MSDSSVCEYKQAHAAQKAVNTSRFRKEFAEISPGVPDPTHRCARAVPGWTAYNSALDKNPLTTKSCTSLVGWAIGDILAQVCELYGFVSFVNYNRRNFNTP